MSFRLEARTWRAHEEIAIYDVDVKRAKRSCQRQVAVGTLE